MTDAHTPWEVGLGFTVSRSKGDFRGKTALMAALGKEQVRNVGLVVEHSDAATGALLVNGRTVGVINSPWSHRMNKSLALAHIQPGIADGAVLEVRGEGIETAARVTSLPFHDPDKSRTRA